MRDRPRNDKLAVTEPGSTRHHPGLRRYVHASTALLVLIPSIWSAEVLRLTLAVGLPLFLGVDFLRSRDKGPFGSLNRLPLFRPEEIDRVSKASYLFLGLALTAWFAAPASTVGMLVGSLGDPAAAWVGTTWAARRTADQRASKTLAGSLAIGVVAATLGSLCGLSGPISLVVGVSLAVLERIAWPDDNLLLAPGVAAAVLLIT